jgi:hypothetical protein
MVSSPLLQQHTNEGGISVEHAGSRLDRIVRDGLDGHLALTGQSDQDFAAPLEADALAHRRRDHHLAFCR